MPRRWTVALWLGAFGISACGIPGGMPMASPTPGGPEVTATHPPPTPTPPGDGSLIALRAGQREGPLWVGEIHPDRVTGLHFREYPVADLRGRPITLHLGESVSDGCRVTLTLIRIEGDVAIFRKRTVAQAICPICLAKGTRIATPAGPIPVEDLAVGGPIWTVDRSGRRALGVILRVSRTPVPEGHPMILLILDDGRALQASPGHPTADGRAIGDLRVGDRYDGARVIEVRAVPSTDAATYDVLPSGETGLYWANGILLGSSLRLRGNGRPRVLEGRSPRPFPP